MLRVTGDTIRAAAVSVLTLAADLESGRESQVVSRGENALSLTIDSDRTSPCKRGLSLRTGVGDAGGLA